MTPAGNHLPVLWHLKVSHYNEKVRWALDYKRIPHVRRAMHPGPHRATARKLTGGRTFPILELNGHAIGDSSEIIEALERSHPDPPLYPSDADARRRALALEEFFDEEFGPHVRLLVLHYVLADSGLMLGTFAPDLPRARHVVARMMFPGVRRPVTTDMGIDNRSVELAFEKVQAAGDRFRAELMPSGYLGGDRFSIADLTLAALASPVVAPEQFPYPQPQRGHALLAAVREPLAASGILEWTRGMYALHRDGSAEIAD